ncbi:TolC family protein [Flavobacterium degerlachei]|uniref:Outer membrane efflux protein n=1 Tax=Flavobacterium degerlachei TaxID=229203 RepID=A0A1H3GMA3_9FLAO|nr:hypothetical protein [Flavobacterium degerlachei]SDY04115.1 hypothetical protein SAMN05444338_12411 [Flavobacterium degerlachei]
MKPLKIILFNLVLFQYSTFCFGQNKNSFLSEIEKNKTRKIDSLVSFNTDKNKLQYLALLPSVNYNFLDNNFNVGISISNLSNFYQNKQRNKIELEKLRFQLIEKKENDLLKLEEEYELIKDTYDILKLEIENTTLTTEIFNLKKKQYENNKITLEDWLNVQKNYQDRNLVVFTKRKSLISKMKHYEGKIKNNCFKKEIDYLSINSNQ